MKIFISTSVQKSIKSQISYFWCHYQTHIRPKMGKRSDIRPRQTKSDPFVETAYAGKGETEYSVRGVMHRERTEKNTLRR